MTSGKLGCKTAKEGCCKPKGIHKKKLRELLFSALKFGCPPFIKKKKTTSQQHLKLVPRVQLEVTLFFSVTDEACYPPRSSFKKGRENVESWVKGCTDWLQGPGTSGLEVIFLGFGNLTNLPFFRSQYYQISDLLYLL